MSYISRIGLVAVWAMLACVGMASEAVAQALPNPYRAVDGWAQLPEGFDFTPEPWQAEAE